MSRTIEVDLLPQAFEEANLSRLPAASVATPLEMQYRSGGEPIGGIESPRGFAIGATLAWRPTKKARFDLSPLIGCSDHTPAVEVFAIFSFSFGGPAGAEAETPASARGH